MKHYLQGFFVFTLNQVNKDFSPLSVLNRYYEVF